MKTISLSQLEAQNGQNVGTSDWYEITQDMIDRFAKVTMDEQFIHIDPVRAKAEGPFGGTIAHGFLTLSLASKMSTCLSGLENMALMVNYGCDKIRFISPVPAGARVRGQFVQTKVEQKTDKQIIIHHTLTIEIEDQDKPALVMQWLGMTILK